MDIIKIVISTLNTIEVKGKNNMSSLLGCIEALETFAQMTEAKVGQEPAQEPEQEADNGG